MTRLQGHDIKHWIW